MIIASISQTKNQLSALIDKVRHGEAVLIMDRDHPVARLEPILANGYSDQSAKLAQLERCGIIRRAAGAPAETFFSSPPRAEKAASLLQTLLSEREDGR